MERTYETWPWGSGDCCHELPFLVTVSPSPSSCNCKYGDRQHPRGFPETTQGLPNLFATTLSLVWSCHHVHPFLVSLWESTKGVSWRKCFSLTRRLFSSNEAQNRYCLWMKAPCIYKQKFDFQEHFLFFMSTDLCTANKAFEMESSLKDLIFPLRPNLRKEIQHSII